MRQIATLAAAEIADAAARGLARGRPLRLFQSGDARTEGAARILARASREWRRHGGAEVWGYTHSWRDVSADAWRGASMLASVESLALAREARARGYAAARIVPDLPSDGKAWSEGGQKWIPCPEQTRGVPCVACGLCFDAGTLASRGAGIAFGAHGMRKNSLKRRLPMVSR